GVSHVAVLAVFIAGIAVLALFDSLAVPKPNSTSVDQDKPHQVNSKGLILIPAAVAAVMGIHGLGEGWSFASVASSTSTDSLVQAFGNIYALASYPLHKFLEAGIIGVLYVIYVKRSNAVKAAWHIPVLGLLFALPSAIGASVGYYYGFDTTYFYAFGVTAAFYAALRSIEAVNVKFETGGNVPSYLGAKVFFAFTLGFLLLYIAALLH
ncbi:MAG: hypothetical protein M1368_13115, partial [Thaumarchaeota archaeon]|nr:hypothetical protein [Nitrososphaerota archaeon]